jgi:deoxyribonuclease V
MPAWPDEPEALVAEQRRLAALAPARWTLPPVEDGPTRVGGVFLAYGTGKQGPGHAGDPGWVGAAVVELPGGAVLACAVVAVPAGAPYAAGMLALREGSALAAALAALPVRPDVVLVDATGRDHPRRAGLALHLGAVAGVPTVGVTHRPLLATGAWPPEVAGAATPLRIGSEAAGAVAPLGVGAEGAGPAASLGVGSEVAGAAASLGVGVEVVGAPVPVGVGAEGAGAAVPLGVGAEVVGAAASLGVGAEVVGAWLRTTATGRPLAVHAAWRTDVETAIEVVRRSVGTARTPEPL